MKVFAIGDVHRNFERFHPEYLLEGQELIKKGVVLQLGDFVGVWFGDERGDEALDTLLQTELPGTKLHLEIDKAVCAHPEKGVAVMAVEYPQANYPGCGDFSHRDLRRVGGFYRAYVDSRGPQVPVLKLGWTQGVATLEGCEGSRERIWYLRTALKHCWTKFELLEQIQAGAWLQSTLDRQTDPCYTEGDTESMECLEHEENPFRVSRQDLSDTKKCLQIKHFWYLNLSFTNDLPIFLESQTYQLPHQSEETNNMEELKKHIYDEHNGLYYTLVDGYYVPDLQLPEETRPIRIWGRVHKDYLVQYRLALYNELILSGRLWTYLVDLDEQAQKRISRLINQMEAAEDTTEELKAHDSMT